MFKKLFIRGFVVVVVLATGGVAVAAVQGTKSGSPPLAQQAAAISPRTSFVTSEASVRIAMLSACGGRALVTSLDAAETSRVDQVLEERALHAAALSGNPLNSGTGFQAGIDDALHVQALDRELATMMCPT